MKFVQDTYHLTAAVAALSEQQFWPAGETEIVKPGALWDMTGQRNNIVAELKQYKVPSP